MSNEFEVVGKLDSPFDGIKSAKPFDVLKEAGCSNETMISLQAYNFGNKDGLKVVESADFKKMIEQGEVLKMANGEIVTPMNVIYKDIDFKKMIDLVPESKVVQAGHKPAPEKSSFNITSSLSVGCKFPDETVIDGGAVTGGTQARSFVGSNSLLKDVLVVGSVATNRNCMLMDCEANDGVSLGIENKVVSVHSCGTKNVKIDSESYIMGGTHSGNFYMDNVHAVDSTNTNYKAIINNFKQGTKSEVIDELLVDTRKGMESQFNYADSAGIEATMGIPMDFSHDHQLPKSIGDKVIMKIGMLELKPYGKCQGDIKALYKGNVKTRMEGELSTLLKEQAAPIEARVAGLIKSHMPVEVNNDIFATELPELPHENKILLDDISVRINKAITNNFSVQNEHADISNDHDLATKISGGINESLKAFAHGKNKYSVTKEEVKRMFNDMVKDEPQFKQFNIVAAEGLDDVDRSADVFNRWQSGLKSDGSSVPLDDKQYAQRLSIIAKHDAIANSQAVREGLVYSERTDLDEDGAALSV